MKLNLGFATMVAVGMGSSFELSAGTLRVPTDFPKIQGAINAAVSGDVISVEPGLYVEAISFLGKDITVQSTQGPQNTAIQSPNSGTPVVTFNTSEPATAVLEGFTVRGGSVGVRIDRCVPVVRNNVIKQNGTGLSFNFASPLIQGNTIVSNSPNGGLALVGSCTAQIVGNDISYNTDTGSGAAIEMFAAGSPVIRNNLISFNSGSGIITMVNDSAALIEQNLVIRNQAGNNGTISWATPSGNRSPRGVINNTIAYNTSALASGIAANGVDGATEIFNNIIYAPGNGTGIWVGGTFDDSIPLIRTNLVFSESGAGYAGIVTGQTGINGNIASNPLFTDALSDDFHLLGGSPAIDVALASRAPAFDFEGVARPVDGNGDGIARPDLGVYESVNVNEAPVADPKTVQLAEDSSAQIELSGSDPDGDPLTFRIDSEPSHGTLSLNGANVVYTPAPNFNGTDSFTYIANDGSEDSVAATVSINVTAVNDAPTANSVAYATDEDTAIAITLLGYDIDGDLLQFIITTAPQHGALSGTAPNLVYTPAANFNGTDSFQFIARDTELASSPATISITVRPVDDAPTAESGNYSVLEDQALSIRLAGTDPDGDAISYAIVNGPAHGVLSGTAPNLVYTPAANFNGTDSFKFIVRDAEFSSGPATVSIAIVPVNDGPTAEAGRYSVLEDQVLNVTLTGSDPDGDALNFLVVNGPAHGVLSGTAPNLVYTPAANFNGADSFQFVARDAEMESSPTTVSITVGPVNDTPIAKASSYSALEDRAVNITLTGNDPDGDLLTYAVVNGPAHGTLSGTGPNLTYTPAANFYGTDSFTFRASDGQAASEAVAITITVVPVNDAPTFTLAGESLTVRKNAKVQNFNGWLQNLSAGPNEFDQTISVHVSNDNAGIFEVQPSISPSGILTFDPRSGQTGVAVVTVKVCDNGGTDNGGADKVIRTFKIIVERASESWSTTTQGKPVKEPQGQK